MRKLLEVREYDLITCNEAYQDHPGYKYLNKKTFEELEKVILTFNDEDEFEAIDFLKINIRRGVGKIIQAKNYVGIIHLESGFQIQILPKINTETVKNTKRIFLRMLRSLKDFPGKNFNDSNLKVDTMNLYEIFINMYLHEVRILVKKGLRSSYLPKEDNLNYYKGKLIFSEHIKQNHIHQERFYVSYDEFDINRAENRLIKSTLINLQKLSVSSANKRAIRQILLYFEGVYPSRNYEKDFLSVVEDRNTKIYNLLMKWSKVFLMNKSFTPFSGDTKTLTLLFPMEKIFETYIAENLKRTLLDLPWQYSTQDTGYYLFDKPRRFALRPDIVIKKQDKRKIVLDAKWKMLNKKSSNFGISQADMYQMYAYSNKYNTSEVWLLYPQNEETKNLEISFESIKYGEIETDIKIFFVDLSNIEKSLNLLRIKLGGKT